MKWPNDVTARGVLALALLAVLAVGAIWGAIRFADAGRARDLGAWRTQLGIVADSRAAQVDQWIDMHYAALRALAENESLQIYMRTLTSGAAGAETESHGDYLRNLLAVAAHRDGFDGQPIGPEVDANVTRLGVAGIALTDRTGRVIAQSPGMPELTGPLAKLAAKSGGRAIADDLTSAGGRHAMAFSVPVHAMLNTGRGARVIGRIIGLKEIGPTLYPSLRQPGLVWQSAQICLVRPAGGAVRYLSPTHGSGKRRSVARDTPDLAAAFALDQPGGFAQKRDYRGQEVLVTSRALAGAPWTLMVTIDRDEALGASDTRRRQLLIALIAGVAAIAALLAAVWRHGASRRTAALAKRNAALARDFAAKENLLRLVTDNLPCAIYILDSDDCIRFVNREAAQQAGIAPEAAIGKPLVNVLGPARAKMPTALNRDVRAQGGAISATYDVPGKGAARVLRADHIPIAPVDGADTGEILVLEQDVSEVVNERERRARMLQQIVRALVAVMDQRDPYATDHSARVATIARAIAEEMELPEQLIDTVEFAGRLMNVGKVLVPEEFLTRRGQLEPGEMDQVRAGIAASADLLANIEFDGPVVETLHQLSAGLPDGPDSLITARIVAAANSFVAMTSERAYRPGADPDAALTAMISEIGAGFDRRVIAALANRFDNRGGRQEWRMDTTN